jgi:glycosyltransferase involved in cell wall biosynthesis
MAVLHENMMTAVAHPHFPFSQRMVSVIVCTHNRAHRLEQTLNSLRQMAVPVDLSWELVIVDNNSSDNTKEIIDRFASQSSLDVKYVFERHQGLSCARNTGIHASSGNIIAFTDDDCIVDRHWITNISKEFRSDESTVGLGGRVLLYDKMDRPVSIRLQKEREQLLSIYRILKLFIGCNMAFARPVFDSIGLFDTDFGAGARFASSEDLDFLYRVYKKGLKIIYSPDVLVYHNHGRRSTEQIKSLMKGYAIGRGAFYCKYILMADKDVMYFACYEISSLIKGIAKKIVKWQPSTIQMLFFTFILVGFSFRLVQRKSDMNDPASV